MQLAFCARKTFICMVQSRYNGSVKKRPCVMERCLRWCDKSKSSLLHGRRLYCNTCSVLSLYYGGSLRFLFRLEIRNMVFGHIFQIAI